MLLICNNNRANKLKWMGIIMKNITLKLIAASLSLLMIATMFSACGSKDGDTEITRANQVIAKPEDTTQPTFSGDETTTGEVSTDGETTTAGSGLDFGSITTRPASTTTPSGSSSSGGADLSGILGLLGGMDSAAVLKFINDMGFLYDSSQGIYYTDMNSWQRDANYFDQYDYFASIANMKYLTNVIDFYYNGLEWRIQLWKGQYGAFGGAEIGVYTRVPGVTDNVYKCANDDQLLNMYYDLYLSQSDYKSNVRYFYRDEWTGAGHWWATGFKAGAVNVKSLVMKGKIRMKSKAMSDAFEIALKKTGFKDGNATSNYDTFYRDGNDFHFLWYAVGTLNYSKK